MIDVIGVLKNQELFGAEQARRDGRPPRTYHGTFDTHPGNDTRLKQVVARRTNTRSPTRARGATTTCRKWRASISATAPIRV